MSEFEKAATAWIDGKNDYRALLDAVQGMAIAEEAYGCGFYGQEKWRLECERAKRIAEHLTRHV